MEKKIDSQLSSIKKVAMQFDTGLLIDWFKLYCNP